MIYLDDINKQIKLMIYIMIDIRILCVWIYVGNIRIDCNSNSCIKESYSLIQFIIVSVKHMYDQKHKRFDNIKLS